MMNEKIKQAIDEIDGRPIVIVYANGNNYGVHVNGIETITMIEAWLAVSHTIFDRLQGNTVGMTPKAFTLTTLSDFLDKKQDCKTIDLSAEAKDEPKDEPKVDEQGMKNPFKGFQKEFHKADPEAETMYEKMTEEERMFADAVLGMITAAITEGRKQ